MSTNDYTGVDDEAELAWRAPAEACSEFLEDPDNDPFAFFQGLVWAVVLVAAAFALAVIITHAISASQTL